MMTDAIRAWKGRKILVAMSGGVDSSLAAALLRRAGAEVVGVHMRVWHYNDCEDDLNGKIATCCSPADAMDARRVAEQFDFPFYSIDFQADFRKAVIDPFVGEYLAGRTPIPCVACNTQLKLGALLRKARAWGAEAVATGHYARVRREGDRAELLAAPDRRKDQSYYLFELRQAQLRRLFMPLGEMTKAEAREVARELDMHVADKPDSKEICFVTDNDYRRFLREEAGLEARDLEGAMVDTAGRVLGRHEGIHNFTIGQRKGLGLAAGEPLYVVDIHPETRTVVVGRSHEVLAEGLEAGRVNWIAREPSAEPLPVRVRIRHQHEPAPAVLYDLSGEGSPGRARIEFERPQRAVTPGQAAVCYDAERGESVVAGGWIERKLTRVSSPAAEIAS